MILTTYLWKSVLAEIKKCVVRCANCHAKKTAKERGYYTADGFDVLVPKSGLVTGMDDLSVVAE